MAKVILLQRGPEPTGPALTTAEQNRAKKLRAEIEQLNIVREAKIKELAALVGPPPQVDLAKEFGNVE